MRGVRRGNEPAIPEHVIDALAAVRASGRTNMLDRRAVAALAGAYGHGPASTWLASASDHAFLAALGAMGARRQPT